MEALQLVIFVMWEKIGVVSICDKALIREAISTVPPIAPGRPPLELVMEFLLPKLGR